MQDRNVNSRLLSLPFDVRHMIYEHLFPKDAQLYIQAVDDGLTAFLPSDKTIPTPFLRVCRALNLEACEYLYNSYLFNIVGTKPDCLANYKRFLKTLRKFGRHEININAFSNGEHSATMCISLQAGDAKMALLNNRRRGQPKTIQELQAEQRPLVSPSRGVTDVTMYMIIGAVIMLVLALLMALVSRSWLGLTDMWMSLCWTRA